MAVESVAGAQWVTDNISVAVNAFSARVGLGFGVSLLNVGSGMIIGLRPPQ
jgi:hypothetical protein